MPRQQTNMTVPAAFQSAPQMAAPAPTNRNMPNVGPISRPMQASGRGQFAQPANVRPAPTMQTGGGAGAPPAMAGGTPTSAPLPASMSGKSASAGMSSPSTDMGSSASTSFAKGGSVPSFAFGGVASSDYGADARFGNGSGGSGVDDNAGWGMGSSQAYANGLTNEQPNEPGFLSGRTFDSGGYWKNGRDVVGTDGFGSTPTAAGADAFSTMAQPAGDGSASPTYYAAGHSGQFGNATDAMVASEGVYADGGSVAGQQDDATAGQPPDFNAAFAKVQAALQFGRQKSGLLQGAQGAGAGGSQPQQPGVIPSGPTQPQQGLAAGGDVQQPPQQASPSAMPGPEQPSSPPQPQGDQASQPPSMAGYVMGTDAMPPDQAQALEAQIDPRQQMDPSARKLLAAAAPSDPNGQWQAMQAQRQKFNSYRAFAQAALQGSKGKLPDLDASTKAATQAYQNVPDGNSVSFQPHQSGGVAVNVKPLAQRGGKAQGFDGGGTVDPLDEDDNNVTLPVNGGNPPLPQPRPASAPQGGTPTPQAQAGVIPSGPSDLAQSLSAGDSADTQSPAAVKAAIQKVISASDFGKYLKGNAGSYDNTMDEGAHTVIQSLPDFVAGFNKANNANYSVGDNNPQAIAGAQLNNPNAIPAGAPQPGSSAPTAPADGSQVPNLGVHKVGGERGGFNPNLTSGDSSEGMAAKIAATLGQGSALGGAAAQSFGQIPASAGGGPANRQQDSAGIDPQLIRQARFLFPRADQGEQQRAYIGNVMAQRAEQASKLDIAKNTHAYSADASGAARVAAAKAQEEGRVGASTNYAGARRDAAQIAADARVKAAQIASSSPEEAGRWRGFAAGVAAGQDPDELMKKLGLSAQPVQQGGAPAQGSGQGGQPEMRFDAQGNGYIKGPDGKPQLVKPAS